MSTWSALAIVAMVAGMTYAMRASVIVALAGREIPVPVARVLRQVGPAVLAALAINLAAGGDDSAPLGLPEIAALVVAGAVGWRWRNVIVSLTAGMTVLWVLTWLS